MIEKTWKIRGVMKMLRRRISFKALKNILQQTWARKWMIAIVDIGYEYRVITFTSEEEQHITLIDGSWLIYNHYLSVRK